jgi:predicted DNA-binding protein (MmcQ/YjbR family)
LETLAGKLRGLALAYPETYEEAPWGDRVVKVRGKIFFFCGVHERLLYVTAKLPASGRAMLKRKDAEPTHYGMGKHGWVTFKFAKEKDVVEGEVRAWIDESFAAVAPKTLLKKQAAATTGKAAAEPAKPAVARRNGKAKAKAVLVCADPVRARRAVEALAARAIVAEVVASAAEVALGRVRALIVDVGRNPREGLKLAAEVDASDRAIHLFVTGVRDAEQERKLRALGSAESFRAPPGDEAVVAAVAGVLLAR